MAAQRGMSREEFWDSLQADIDALPTVEDKRRRGIPMNTDALPAAHSVVVEAARSRKMSLSAYVRRAAYAMACRDLGLPLAEVLERDPRVSRDTGLALSDPTGTRFGRWEIERLVGDVEPDPG